MADPRHVLGLAAEEATAAWLERSGWRVVGRRCRAAGGGEVDLLALDAQRVLVAVEIRARRTGRTGAPAETVGARHVERIRRTLVASAPAAGRHGGLRVDLVVCEPLVDRPGRWRLTRIPGVG